MKKRFMTKSALATTLALTGSLIVTSDTLAKNGADDKSGYSSSSSSSSASSNSTASSASSSSSASSNSTASSASSSSSASSNSTAGSSSRLEAGDDSNRARRASGSIKLNSRKGDLKMTVKVRRTADLKPKNADDVAVRATFPDGLVCELEFDDDRDTRPLEFKLRIKDRNGRVKVQKGDCNEDRLPVPNGGTVNVVLDLDDSPETENEHLLKGRL